MDDYEKYEADCKRIRAENKKLIDQFATWLEASNLSKKTIDNHCRNIDFYVNDFLLYEDAVEAPEGVYEVEMFLGYWFIKKAMWASQSSIKGNAVSLKKFYTFMCEQGLVEQDALIDLKTQIKEEMPDWLATLRRYDNPNLDMGEVWGLI